MRSRSAILRVQTGSFVDDQMQTTARRAVQRANALQQTIDDYVCIALKETFRTTLATAQPTALSFQVRKGDLWMFEYWGLAGCSGSANGMKYAIGAPPGTTVSAILDSSLTTAIDDSHQQITAINTLTSAVHTVNGSNRDDYMNARLRIGGDGRVTLRACSTTAGNETSILALAILRAERFIEAA